MSKITKEEAEEIIYEFEYWDGVSCSCHMGNPPCGKCVSTPSEEEYEQACKILEQNDKI